MQDTEKYEIEKEETTKKKFIPKSYYATKSECQDMRLRRGSPKIGAYKNINTWRKGE